MTETEKIYLVRESEVKRLKGIISVVEADDGFTKITAQTQEDARASYRLGYDDGYAVGQRKHAFI